MTQVKWMKSTFDGSRRLPEAIALRDEHIEFGPFCTHCGTPEHYHSATKRCPAVVGAIFPPPCCGCHGVKEPVGAVPPPRRVFTSQ